MTKLVGVPNYQVLTSCLDAIAMFGGTLLRSVIWRMLIFLLVNLLELFTSVLKSIRDTFSLFSRINLKSASIVFAYANSRQTYLGWSAGKDFPYQ